MTNKLNDDDVKEELTTIAGDLIDSIKKAARSTFNLMVDRTAETASNLTDKGVECLKDKIDKRKDNDSTDKEK